MADIVFDFDGTVADSLALITEVFYEVIGRETRLTSEEIAHLRQLSVLEVARKLGIPWWRIPIFIRKGRQLMHTRIGEIKPFPGIVKVIKELHEADNHLYIISSNSRSNVNVFLRQHELHDYFRTVYGNVRLYGKARALRRLQRRFRLHRNQMVYIGDEPRDIRAAHEARVTAIAVAWGFSEQQNLLDMKPAAYVKHPEEITKAIKDIL